MNDPSDHLFATLPAVPTRNHESLSPRPCRHCSLLVPEDHKPSVNPSCRHCILGLSLIHCCGIPIDICLSTVLHCLDFVSISLLSCTRANDTWVYWPISTILSRTLVDDPELTLIPDGSLRSYHFAHVSMAFMPACWLQPRLYL